MQGKGHFIKIIVQYWLIGDHCIKGREIAHDWIGGNIVNEIKENCRFSVVCSRFAKTTYVLIEFKQQQRLRQRKPSKKKIYILGLLGMRASIMLTKYASN